MSDYSALLREAARRTGILDAYRDLWGTSHEASETTLYALLRAMGVAADGEDSLRAYLAHLDDEDGQSPCEPVVLLNAVGEQRIPLKRPSPGLRFSLYGDPLPVREQSPQSLALEAPLSSGVYEAQGVEANGAAFRATLIVSPAEGYRPEAMARGNRLWGLNLPLYGLRSEEDWGVGDFHALAGVARWAAAQGANALGLLPLHALFNDPPLGTSPYYPSSRLFLNPLYIHVPSAPGADAPDARAFWETETARREIERLRALPLVDHAAVWALKKEALERVFAAFAAQGAPEAREDFAQWRRRGGASLEAFCTFCALREQFLSPEGHPTHWRAWPRDFARPDTEAVQSFAAEHSRRIAFFAYLQWVADAQLGRAAQAAREAGMAVGLYLDMALGVDPGGADAWCHQEVFALEASAGCPPDPFSLLGQKWGLPPLIPRLQRKTGYALLRQTVGRNAYHAGAIRIDHAASLARLFWIPAESPAKEGAYVSERLDELLALLRAQSAGEHCLIVGEDLGTVPQEVRDGLQASGFLSYRLMMFERGDDGAFLDPSRFPANALVSFGTHDLPTLDGWLLGTDLEVKRRLKRYPDAAAERDERKAREADRLALIDTLRREGLLPSGFSPDQSPGATMSPAELDAVAVAVHRRLARTASALALVNLDDLLGEREMQNLPGTLDEHPNWRRKASLAWELWGESSRMRDVLEALRSERAFAEGGAA